MHMTMASAPNVKPKPETNSDRLARGRTLLRDTKLALEQFQHREISFEELGRYAGQAGSTVFDKLLKPDHPQIEGLIGWLEHLPEEVRAGLVNRVLRTLPNLEHRRLAHDPVQVTALKSLLRQHVSLTLIVAPNEGLTTWLITALGHGSQMLGADHRLVTGVDRHVTDWFVPVDGVNYLETPLTQCPAPASIAEAWRKSIQSGHGVVLLNGVVSLATSLRKEVLAMAGARNVFVADHDSATRDWFARHASPAHQLRKLTVVLADRDRIQVRVEPLKRSLLK